MVLLLLVSDACVCACVCIGQANSGILMVNKNFFKRNALKLSKMILAISITKFLLKFQCSKFLIEVLLHNKYFVLQDACGKTQVGYYHDRTQIIRNS